MKTKLKNLSSTIKIAIAGAWIILIALIPTALESLITNLINYYDLF